MLAESILYIYVVRHSYYMECFFKLGFSNLKQEILDNSTQEKFLFKLNNNLVFVKGKYHVFQGKEYLFVAGLHPEIKNILKQAEGIYFGCQYNYDIRKTEYIIKIEDSERYFFSNPIVLHIETNRQGQKIIESRNITGYYSCGKIIGLSLNNNNGDIGFLPETYIPLLKGETKTIEYKKRNKIYMTVTYSITGDDDTKNFMINKILENG